MLFLLSAREFHPPVPRKGGPGMADDGSRGARWYCICCNRCYCSCCNRCYCSCCTLMADGSARCYCSCCTLFSLFRPMKDVKSEIARSSAVEAHSQPTTAQAAEQRPEGPAMMKETRITGPNEGRLRRTASYSPAACVCAFSTRAASPLLAGRRPLARRLPHASCGTSRRRRHSRSGCVTCDT